MKSSRKVGIVGYGYVGKAMHRFFSNHYEVRIYDVDAKQAKDVSFSTPAQINECDLVLICVPTPPLPDGKADTKLVKEVIDWLEVPLIILKSTVPPGTTDQLCRSSGKPIVFSPEYCGESSYWTPYAFHTDVKETPFFTFGGAPENTSRAVEFYLTVVGPVKTYRQTTARAAEMAKYMENCFYAMKITFCYEFASLCQAAGLDFHEVRELWLLDPRINPMHTAVFAENSLPFSGKCLPKDLAAMVSLGKSLGYEPKLLEEVLRSNDRIGDMRKQKVKSAPTRVKKAA